MEEYEIRFMAVELAVLWDWYYTAGCHGEDARWIMNRMVLLHRSGGDVVMSRSMELLRKSNKFPWVANDETDP